MHFFGFACSKARQLRMDGIKFNEDYVFGKLAEFVRSCIEKGNVLKGSGAMSTFTFMAVGHPEVLKLAKELSESEDELTRSNAKLLLKKHEQRKRAQDAKENRGQRGEADSLSETQVPNRGSNEPDSVGTTSYDQESLWGKWPVMLVIILALGGVFVWLKTKPRVQ